MIPRSSTTSVSGGSYHRDPSLVGLAGKFCRPIKLTFLGAGSFFCPRLINDLDHIPGHQGGIIALVDIDPGRLAISARLIRRLLSRAKGRRWKVLASIDRKTVLKGSDYVVNCIEVSGSA